MDNTTKPMSIYVVDFPDFKGNFGEDTIVVKAQNWAEAEAIIKHYYVDAKQKLENCKRYHTTLLEYPK